MINRLLDSVAKYRSSIHRSVSPWNAFGGKGDEESTNDESYVALPAHRIELLTLVANKDSSQTSKRSDTHRVVRVPATLFEAQDSPDWDCWKAAMDTEMQSMADFGVWKLVP